MKKFLKIVIALSVLGVLIYQLWLVKILNVESIPLAVREFFTWPAPCEKPIPYELGTFDPKFNISKDYFLTALKDAEAIWEKSITKDLFAYTPESPREGILKINLIYDYRQQATDKLKSL